ncbi:uncharacterized protein LOC132901922 [Amyelois transitella]|uniref:uncharacterized protein LOC132901922 n=1 Tax=Amyelois transitella TaxID=680683 RepID=UPI00298F785B|nr:uncharacterized protein LOC132901922 [Amyelois transitella]
MTNCYFFGLFLIAVVMGLKVIPQRVEVIKTNSKYLKNFSAYVRRHSKDSIYYIDISGESLCIMDNNITMSIDFFEVLSGRFVPLPFRLEFKLCDFLLKDLFLGQSVRKQLGENMTCPLKVGKYEHNSLSFDEMDFPFDIPFTYQGYETMGCLHYKWFVTDTKDIVLFLRFHYKIIQKPRNKS